MPRRMTPAREATRSAPRCCTGVASSSAPRVAHRSTTDCFVLKIVYSAKHEQSSSVVVSQFMSELAGLILSLNAANASSNAALRSLPSGVSAIRLRADLADDVDPGRIRDDCRRPLIYQLRRSAEDGSDARRQQRLRDAAGRFDFIELDAECDLVPHLLATIAPSRRLISWHGAASDAASLARRFAAMAQVPAALYLLAPRARHFRETIAPLQLRNALPR